MSKVIQKVAVKSKIVAKKVNRWMDSAWPFSKMSPRARAWLALLILIIPGSILAYLTLVIIHGHLTK